MSRYQSRMLASLIVLLLTSSLAGAQILLASANPTAPGQRAIFKVIGKTSAVCLGAFQLTTDGNLLTFSTYYVGALQTIQVVAPPIAHFPTTLMFALFEPTGGATKGCNSVPNSFINDPTRVPKIFETLTGGGDGPPINISQIAGAVNTLQFLCNGGITVTQGNGNNDAVTISTNSLCNQIAVSASASFTGDVIQNATAIVTFGFEEISFEPANSGPLVNAFAACGTPSFQTAGATLIVSCQLPTTGGTFDGQGYH